MAIFYRAVTSILGQRLSHNKTVDESVRQLSWLAENLSLQWKWNFISTSTELDCHNKELWPKKVTSNSHFCGVAWKEITTRTNAPVEVWTLITTPIQVVMRRSTLHSSLVYKLTNFSSTSWSTYAELSIRRLEIHLCEWLKRIIFIRKILARRNVTRWVDLRLGLRDIAPNRCDLCYTTERLVIRYVRL